jgi:prepilin-type N-terminal cleavage/methylation domain-containing protein
MKKLSKAGRRGFTLIELLVVIAIIAVLALVVVLTLNPGELIRQARDSNRISDLATIKSAIAYYQQDQAPSSFGTASVTTCYEDGPVLSGGIIQTTSSCPWMSTATSTVVSTTTRSTNTTSSWIQINLGLISVGAPIGQWPVDPLNTINTIATGTAFNSSNYYYSFAVSSTVSGGFKVAAKMESTKFSKSGSGDIESTDGGTYTSTYETGSNVQL